MDVWRATFACNQIIAASEDAEAVKLMPARKLFPYRLNT